METNKKAEKGTKGHIYVVDGEEWIVGEQKISKWSNAKCNKEKEEKNKKEDHNKGTASSFKDIGS